MFNDPQFWVLIAFIVFIVVIINPVRKILTTNLDNKINEIKSNIVQAEKLKNDAQETLSEIKKRQNQVSTEITSINKKTEEKIFEIEKNIYGKLDNQIDRAKKLFKTKINQMNRETNIEIKEYVVQEAINASIMLLRKKLNENEKQNLIKQSIAQFKKLKN